MFRPTSIRSRLRLSFAICLSVLISISVFAIATIATLERVVEALNRDWLAGTQMLGELADNVSEFRIDERGLAAIIGSDEASRRAATTARDSGEARAYEIRKRLETFSSTRAAAGASKLLAAFENAWSGYLADHRAWSSLPVERRVAEWPSLRFKLGPEYEATQRAIDALIGSNRLQAAEAAARGEFIVEMSAAVLSIVTVLSISLVGWIMLGVRNNVSRPLNSMTRALSELAAGNRDVVVPESDRADEIGELAKALEIFRANTFALEKAHRAAEEAQLRAQALARHDPLTGLTNRRVLAEELEQALSEGTSLALLLIDLDRFKPVNDMHGHAAGDAVLVEVAARLQAAVREGDIVSRLGGDEFAVLCHLSARGKEASDEMISFADRMLAAVRAPMRIAAGLVEIEASIGISLSHVDGDDAEALLRAADVAMYRAKRVGRGMFRFYERSMDEELRARAELEVDVRRAVATGAITPYYQPLVDLHTSMTVGFEVLARWTHPERGNVPPDVFVPVIEHMGLIGAFTWSLLRAACLDSRRWDGRLRLSVNISPQQLTDPAFATRLLAILHDTGFSPDRLEIEITETALLTDIDAVKVTLAAVQAIGVTVALDDFGTGYSSLNHLRELKLDKIKIDRSFIQSIRENPESRKIVNGILGMAKSLNIPTTAEGIEDQDIATRMTALGCEIGQGYAFAKAMPADAVEEWLQRQNPSARTAELKLAAAQ